MSSDMNSEILSETNIDSKQLNVHYHRTCDCASSHINCLSAKEWIKDQLGVWTFYYGSRDIRDKEKHPATYPISLASRIISLFTHRGELVIDPFVGSGTTLVAAKDLDRNAIGFDINESYIDLCMTRLTQTTLSLSDEPSIQMAMLDDARNIPQYVKPGTVSLILTSPPYANLLNRKRLNKSRRTRQNNQYLKVEQYSQKPEDLGTLSIADY